MHDFNESLRKLFNGPICPHCATSYDPAHYDFVEDRAVCLNCAALYRVGAGHVPDIPDEDLDIDLGEEQEAAAIRQFRADTARLAGDTARATGGASYELYALRFSEACDALLDALDPATRDQAVGIAEYHGYFEDDEAEAGFGPGLCSFSGIEAHYCHCGRHP